MHPPRAYVRLGYTGRRGTTVGLQEVLDVHHGHRLHLAKQEPIILTEPPRPRSQSCWPIEDAPSSLALRVAVKPGGCSGFSYDMFFDTEVAEDDLVRTFGDVRWSWTTRGPPLLSGPPLDYSDGLQGAGFHITNPNATQTCGCGSSFS